MTRQTRLGPRERELLAVLRRADDSLAARGLHDAVTRRGDALPVDPDRDGRETRGDGNEHVRDN